MNGWICFVCFFTLQGKQIKLICLFFGKIYSSPICFLILSDHFLKQVLLMFDWNLLSLMCTFWTEISYQTQIIFCKNKEIPFKTGCRAWTAIREIWLTISNIRVPVIFASFLRSIKRYRTPRIETIKDFLFKFHTT